MCFNTEVEMSPVSAAQAGDKELEGLMLVC